MNAERFSTAGPVLQCGKSRVHRPTCRAPMGKPACLVRDWLAQWRDVRNFMIPMWFRVCGHLSSSPVRDEFDDDVGMPNDLVEEIVRRPRAISLELEARRTFRST